MQRRLELAAQAGFVIALYNPVSKARPWQLDKAFDLLRAALPGTVPVLFGRAVGRVDESLRVVPLAEAKGAFADMATCIIIGSAETRIVERTGLPALVYTPRSSKGGA